MVLLIPEGCVSWVQEDVEQSVKNRKAISHLHLKHLLFDVKVTFNLHGIATFEKCIIYGHYFDVNLYKGRSEPDVQNEELYFHGKQYKLLIVGTQFLVLL